MESTPAIKMTHAGKEKKKSSTPLRELVMEALQSAPSTGMAVSEIYEFVNRRCKKYDLSENKWKINVRNMLTTSVYFQCFPRKERDGRRGKCWKFNKDAYNLHLQMKGNRRPLAGTPTTEDIRRSFTGSIDEIQPPDHASFNNFNANTITLNPSPAFSQQTAPSRIHPTHQDNTWPSSNIIATVRPQQMQMSSMLNQHASHPIQLQQTHYSHVTDFANTVRADPVDVFSYYNNAQHAQFLCDSGTIERRNSVNRFTPYDVRDSRTFSYLQNPIARPAAGLNQDTRGRPTQRSSQPYSLTSVNSDMDSYRIAQAYPPIDTRCSYFPQSMYSQAQLRSTDSYHYGMSQGTIPSEW